MSWLNSGTYTYNHRNDTYPIGMDLDLTIFSPSGTYVGGSASFYNGEEVVDFDPTSSGNYRACITQYRDRDPTYKLNIALVAHWE